MASVPFQDAAAELLAFLRPDETAAAFLARTYVEPLRTGVPLIDQHLRFRAGHVLEVAGASGSGKSELLLQAAATCVLPEEFERVPVGGAQGHVLLFDLDAKFDVLRMHAILDSYLIAALRRTGVPGSNADLSARAEPAVHAALARLHVVRCHGSFDFLAALKTARPALRAMASGSGAPDGSSSGDGGRPVAIMVDNIAAYWYIDRAARGAAAAAGGGSASYSSGPAGAAAALAAMLLAPPSSEQQQQQWQQQWQQHYAPPPPPAPDITLEGAPLSAMRVAAAAAAELRSLAQEFRVPVLATKHAVLPQQGKAEDPWAIREFMPKPWLDLVTHRLLLRAPPSMLPAAADDGWGEGGGADGSAAGISLPPPERLARWQAPDEGPVMRWTLEDDAIRLI